MSGNINAVIVIIILFSHNLTNEWSEQLTMQYVCIHVYMYSYVKMAVPSSMPQKFYCMLFKNNYTLKRQQQLRRRI